MTVDTDTILAGPPAGRHSWLQRLGRSNAFTITLSVALHGAAFLAFYHVAFREDRARPTLIIPEARLAAIGGGGPTRSGEMPKLSLQPAPPPPGGARAAGAVGPAGGSPLRLSELPVVAVNLTSGAGVVVGDADGSSRGSAGLAGVGTAGASLLGTGYGGGGGGGGGELVGPATSFFGVAGNAYKVVYVIDVSNSLMAWLDQQVVTEMKKAINDLMASQQFHIILATPVHVIEFGPKRLVYATAANKDAAVKFVEANVHMTQDVGPHAPVDGLRRAFEVGPELIYFVSDGDFFEDDQAALKNLVAEKSPHGEIKLTTLGFGMGNKRLLEDLARQTGGNFRYTDYK